MNAFSNTPKMHIINMECCVYLVNVTGLQAFTVYALALLACTAAGYSESNDTLLVSTPIERMKT